MISIREDTALLRALELPIDDRLKRLLRKRRRQLGEDFELTELAHFLVVQPADKLPALERALGFDVLVNQVDGSRFGQADFSPSSEWIADHGFCFEAVFVFEDSGYGHVLVVPKTEGIDTNLIAFCEQFALPGAECQTRA
ncbi:hypothetical protein [Sphingomonas jaspsi]|uniref:hypothetical protein n=1 Tax=Sphingomonas jaspsi TaxID=392409 RepID=UPI00056C19C8|nr:hypothetical protein [Sphingomonas jaspsi]